ncbi:MAG: efflux RND transporter periplasmic adaptor subunit [Clostridia bacterium]|nr:efflux RND transporter periplasmic adaptor subunit [Clostridia bacterium]MDY5555655.1 efflux RND transporter periplasmic adaptor subunit [Blautia sp.]
MKKKKKKLIIAAAAVLIAAGGILISGKLFQDNTPQIPQLPVVTASRGDVEEIVEVSGIVGSEEEKTYYSPVSARIKKASFETGDVVRKGTKLIEFDTEDLEKEEKKAELSLKSGQYDYKNALNKSDEAENKQKDAKSDVKDLEKKIDEKKAYISSLKSQISQAASRAQSAAAAQAQAQARAQTQAAAAQAGEQARKQQEIQQRYEEAVYTYQSETLPQYQQKLADLGDSYNQAQTAFNQADTDYQMAFSAWQADPSEENTQALNEAQAARSQTEITKEQAKEAYEDMKTQVPQMPVLADFSIDDTGSALDFISDGSKESSPSENWETESTGESVTVSPDTSGLESAMEKASEELAELQSDLASKKAIAEADPAGLTKEEKAKLKVTDNLSRLEAKSAEELVEEGKKGITAEFNGIISKSAVSQGATVSQGMELFSIQNTDKTSVDVNISKYDYDSVKTGQKAEITIGGHTYKGTVRKMSHIAVQNEKGTSVITAQVSVDDADQDIFLGVDAKVKIHAASARNVVILPAEVINIGKDGPFCYVIEDGVITRKNVSTGISSEEYVEITDGIKEGDQVISDLEDYEEGMNAQAASEKTGEDVNE